MPRKKVLKKVGIFALVGLALAGGGYGVFKLVNEPDNNKQMYKEVSEKVENRVFVDISNETSITLTDGSSIDLTHINIQGKGSALIGEEENLMSIYGLADNLYSFKNEYSLTDEQYEYLSNKSEVIKRLGEIINDLQLKSTTVNSHLTMSLGLSSEDQFSALARMLGTPEAVGDLGGDYKYHIPLMSDIKIVKENGKSYAVMNLEGVDIYAPKGSDFELGFSVGYGYGMEENNPALAYALGAANSLKNSIISEDAYLRKETISMEIEDKNYNYYELMNLMVNKMLDFDHENIKTETDYFSASLAKGNHQEYAQLSEQELTK